MRPCPASARSTACLNLTTSPAQNGDCTGPRTAVTPVQERYWIRPPRSSSLQWQKQTESSRLFAVCNTAAWSWPLVRGSSRMEQAPRPHWDKGVTCSASQAYGFPAMAHPACAATVCYRRPWMRALCHRRFLTIPLANCSRAPFLPCPPTSHGATPAAPAPRPALQCAAPAPRAPRRRDPWQPSADPPAACDRHAGRAPPAKSFRAVSGARRLAPAPHAPRRVSAGAVLDADCCDARARARAL